MARILVFSGAGLYADPWHPFPETSSAVAELLLHGGHRVLVRDSEPGCLLDLPQFDLLVVNSGGRTGEPSAEEAAAWIKDHRALREFHESGSPILALHTAVGTFPDWPAWAEIIGGRWGQDAFHPDIGTATFRPADGAQDHPIWEGVDSLEAFDERYSNLELLDGSVPMIQHDTPGVQPVMGWLVGESVIYDGLGHDERSYESDGRRQVLLNEVHWLLGH